MLHGFEDYAEVPPVEGDSVEARASRSLLRWALMGSAPLRYLPYVPSNPLLTSSDVKFFTTVARDLQSGLMGGGLTEFGRTLASLIEPEEQGRW